MRVRLTQDLLMLVRRTLGLLMRVRLTQDLLMLVRRTLGLLMPAPRMRVRRPSSSRTTSIAPAGSARTGVSFPDRGTPARLLRGPDRAWTEAPRRWCGSPPAPTAAYQRR